MEIVSIIIILIWILGAFLVVGDQALVTIVGLGFGALGFLVGVASLVYAIYNERRLSESMKVGALVHIRILIERLDEDKKLLDTGQEKSVRESPRFLTLHHTQQNLEALSTQLEATFNIPRERVMELIHPSRKS